MDACMYLLIHSNITEIFLVFTFCYQFLINTDTTTNIYILLIIIVIIIIVLLRYNHTILAKLCSPTNKTWILFVLNQKHFF